MWYILQITPFYLILCVAKEEQELEALIESLSKICIRYKIEISAAKTELMTNIANDIQRENKIKEQDLVP